MAGQRMNERREKRTPDALKNFKIQTFNRNLLFFFSFFFVGHFENFISPLLGCVTVKLIYGKLVKRNNNFFLGGGGKVDRQPEVLNFLKFYKFEFFDFYEKIGSRRD